MPTFLLLFFLLYALYQLYFYVKLRRATPLPRRTTIALATFLLLVPAMPIMVHFAEQAGLDGLAKPLAYAGYLWLGFIFLFVTTGLAFDVCRPLLSLLPRVLAPRTTATISSPRTAFLVPTVLALILCGYGFYDALQIRTETLVIETPKLAATHSPFRIVQISDIHLGPIVGRARLSRILTAVKHAKPDVLISTGDLVDGRLDGMTPLANMLAEIAPRYGKYAITGNHEYYAGIAQALDFTRRAGFTVLAGKAVRPGGRLAIVGIDDRGHTPAKEVDQAVETSLLADQDPSLFTLFLKHRPEIAPASVGLFDLQLSGHTHKGQIFPFSFVIKAAFITDAGLLKLAKESWLYVSRGTGTWGPPIRLLSPPEITVIELRHSDTPAVESGTKPGA